MAKVEFAVTAEDLVLPKRGRKPEFKVVRITEESRQHYTDRASQRRRDLTIAEGRHEVHCDYHSCMKPIIEVGDFALVVERIIGSRVDYRLVYCSIDCQRSGAIEHRAKSKFKD